MAGLEAVPAGSVGRSSPVGRLRRAARLRLGVALLAVLLVVAGCTDDLAEEELGGDEENPSADAATTADPEPGSPAAAVGPVLAETGEDLTGPELEEYLARRYEAYWQAFDIARGAPTDNPDTDYPELFNLAAGDQLNLAYVELGELFEAGHAIREPDAPAIPGLDANTSHRVRIGSLEDGVAELVSCLVNDQIRYDVETGDVVSASVRTVQARSTMARAEGTWKVIRSEAVALESGVGGCWLDEGQYPY